ncbi:ABC transporter permease [Streptomyces sp. NBC_01260]|uniref:ABC transporter permease n=1 Tax=unclassified Streptomyces TaxID=2593676 RepID=UPI000F55258C|nr:MULTISPECIES: ABC transporter permease [unclassified Streptomyces]MCX4770325.1 ABC transporter permease [Streptomyces sp. NBC_01285]RPK44811.1 Dipeptide transport system permease protein DppB [Streptomyces sp. ADI92-24]
MARYLLHRLVVSVLVLLGISVVVFLLLHLVSASPGRIVLGQRASPQAVAAFNHDHGFDRSLIAQYLSYLGQLLHGDLGRSYTLNENVSTLLAQNSGRSAMLSLAGLVLALIVAVPLGILQAVRRNSIADRAATASSYVLYAMPSFLLGLVLIAVFSQTLQIFPAEASQSHSPWVVFTDPRAMALPVITLACGSVTVFAQYQRSSALDQLGQDYIRVARAKGLPERLVLLRHLLRNACLPLITLVGTLVPTLLAGNLIVESLFNYPGLGLLFLNSLQREDYPLLLAYTLIGGFLTVAGSFIADLLVAAADRRIELRK